MGATVNIIFIECGDSSKGKPFKSIEKGGNEWR